MGMAGCGLGVACCRAMAPVIRGPLNALRSSGAPRDSLCPRKAGIRDGHDTSRVVGIPALCGNAGWELPPTSAQVPRSEWRAASFAIWQSPRGVRNGLALLITFIFLYKAIMILPLMQRARHGHSYGDADRRNRWMEPERRERRCRGSQYFNQRRQEFDGPWHPQFDTDGPGRQLGGSGGVVNGPDGGSRAPGPRRSR